MFRSKLITLPGESMDLPKSYGTLKLGCVLLGPFLKIRPLYPGPNWPNITVRGCQGSSALRVRSGLELSLCLGSDVDEYFGFHQNGIVGRSFFWGSWFWYFTLTGQPKLMSTPGSHHGGVPEFVIFELLDRLCYLRQLDSLTSNAILGFCYLPETIEMQPRHCLVNVDRVDLWWPLIHSSSVLRPGLSLSRW
jgi:hypothetical protein